MNDIIPYNYKHHEVRTVMIEGEPRFVAADVCRVLELSNTTEAVRKITDRHRSLNQFEGGGEGNRYNCVSETGLYLLISRSDKPEARAFMLWVCEVVLPQIRKTGSYTIGQLVVEPQSTMSELERIAKSLD